MPRPLPAKIMSRLDVENVGEILSRREGRPYKFFRFLNLSKFSLVYLTEGGDQRVLTMDNAKEILHQGE